jgi:hypothetical protein
MAMFWMFMRHMHRWLPPPSFASAAGRDLVIIVNYHAGLVDVLAHNEVLQQEQPQQGLDKVCALIERLAFCLAGGMADMLFMHFLSVHHCAPCHICTMRVPCSDQALCLF